MPFPKFSTTSARSLSVVCFVLTVCLAVPGQILVDKTLAVVSDGLGRELITLSDIRWQLALQPQKPIDPPSQADLDDALRLTVNQRIFALEAQRVPRNAPTEQEIRAEIESILRFFPSTSEFERRLRLVGFSSVQDENFEQLISKRLAIDKYIDFRFRSFAVVSREDENDYYESTFVPDFRTRNPGRVVPALENVREQINGILIENVVAESIELFLDEARLRVDVAYYNGEQGSGTR